MTTGTPRARNPAAISYALELRRECGDSHEIGLRQGLVVDRSQVLVKDDNFPVGRGQAGQNQQSERFPEAESVPVAPVIEAEAYEPIRRIDQIQKHGLSERAIDCTNMTARRPGGLRPGGFDGQADS